MTKKIVYFTVILSLIFSSYTFANDIKILNDAFKKFSTSPFSTLSFEGWAFFFGDNLTEVPFTITYSYDKSKDKTTISAIDGLFGAPVFNFEVNKDTVVANVDQWQTNFTANINTITINTPILKYPKMFIDILAYRFIDTSRNIKGKSIELGQNWHTLTVDYNDRVDKIIFSAKTMRVRRYQSQYYNNTLTVDMSMYTNIDGIDYPLYFELQSTEDKRKIQFNISKVDGKK